MVKDEPIVTVEKLRDELIKTAIKVRSGELAPAKGNAVANLVGKALYAEQIRYQQEKGQELKVELEGTTELTQADRERLDNIAKLLSGDTPKRRGRKPKEAKE